MMLFRPAALAILGFAFLSSPAGAQPLQYRVSVLDEGTYYRLNLDVGRYQPAAL